MSKSNEILSTQTTLLLTKKNVKTFIFYRDKVKMAEMKEAVKLARVPQNYHTKWKKPKNMVEINPICHYTFKIFDR
jgi:hypothetical protein